ncbi:MFS transporter [Sphingobacterium sp. N143]|uniref:MFS transporter n=1 Tax=Sphingobacterium sp. N143 TaxID=2746727 RepID=UPI00257737E4|nr:MFS transporter [Sphingobacterium sp. N143]MDM1293762.1 MFS transporter [Sphingobacterium sp. N143]
MNPNKSLYYNWVPEWIKLPMMILAMFPHLMLMSLFHSNTTFTASALEIEAEDIQYFLSLMYGAIVVALLIFQRLFAFFRVRTYILLTCSLSILVLLAISMTRDPFLIGILRVVEGIFCVLEGACFLPMLMMQIRHTKNRTIAYFFLYTFMLTGSTITTSLLKESIMDYGWEDMIHVVLYWHLMVIAIALLFLNNNRLGKKFPLYQLDLASCLFLLISLSCAAYVLIYGRKYYWFEHSNIVIDFALSLIFGALFVIKQYMVKRPLFHFEVLKYKNVIIGVILFFLFYIIRSSLNNVYTVMANVWKWPWHYIIDIQYINVIGTMLGVGSSGVLLLRDVSPKYIFGSGFLILSASCFLFVPTFYPDTTSWTIGLPLFIQGIGQGWLFTPLVIYILTGVAPHHVGNAGLMGTTVRFWSTNIGFSLVQNISYLLNQKHFIQLEQTLNSSAAQTAHYWNTLLDKYTGIHGDLLANQLASKSLSVTVSQQASLISNMEIFTYLGFLGVLITALIFLFGPAKAIFMRLKIPHL